MALNKITIATLSLLLLCPLLAQAALFIDDTSTTERGSIDIDYWVDYYKDVQYNCEQDYKSRTRETRLLFYALTGLSDNWDIGITIPYGYINYDRDTKTNGFMDIEIESKYRFFEENGFLPSLAVYLDFISSSGNDEKSLGSGEQDLFLNLIFSRTIREDLFWLDWNLGYYFSGGKDADDVFIYAFGLTRGFKESFFVFAELYGEAEFERNFNNNVCITALSIGYEINPNLFVKIGAAAGISDAANDLQISSRFSFSF